MPLGQRTPVSRESAAFQGIQQASPLAMASGRLVVVVRRVIAETCRPAE